MPGRAKASYDKAIADFDEVIRLTPENADAYFYRGNAWNAKGAYDKAVADFTEAIRLDPKDGRAYANRGTVLLGMKGEYDKAIADFTEAIRLDPNTPRRTPTGASPGADEGSTTRPSPT